MTKRRQPLAILGLIGVAALTGAGCGSSAPAVAARGPTTVSLSTTSGFANTNDAKREKAVKFAECVRARGVPHFPDPDASGNFNFGVDVSAAVFTNAVNACKSLQPPGSLSGKRSPLQQSAALRFAQCVREKGVKDFPDPVNGQPLINTDRIPSSNQPGGMTILNAATHKCGHVLGTAAGAR
jgi:hypothetical protein